MYLFDFHGVPDDIGYVLCEWLAYVVTLLHRFLLLCSIVGRGDMKANLVQEMLQKNV